MVLKQKFEQSIVIY